MRLLAIDGDSLFRTAWEASDDASLATVSRRVLNRIVQSIAQWERTVVAFDGGPGGGVGGFRRAHVPTYKAHRTDPGQPFREQRQRVIDALKHERCTVIVGPSVSVETTDGNTCEGFCEADDVLAWAAEWFYDAFSGEPESVMRIVSNDGDLETLATDEEPRVEVFKPIKSREDPVYTAKRIETERGIDPEQIPLLKALCGDKSDNYPGFKGIGDATAAMLIRYYGGDASKIVAEAPDDESIPPKELNKSQRVALREGGIELITRGLWLARLRADLPLDFSSLVISPPEPEPRPKDYAFTEQKPIPQVPAPVPAQSTAIEVRQSAAMASSSDINPFALQPGSLDSLYELSLALHRSGLYSHLQNTVGIIAGAFRRKGMPVSTEPMSNAMLVASLRGILPDIRRVRDRLLGVGAQADAGLLRRLDDEQGVTDLYAVIATVRELSRSGEKRVASVQSNLYNNASAALRRAFQRAYDLGSREARAVAQSPVSGRPACCQDAALESGVFWYGGGWCARFNISPRRIDFCPFCGSRLPEVMP